MVQSAGRLPAFSLEGKVVLVTGGTSGIGAASAVAFAKAGASVVVSGRREREGEEVARAVRDTGGKGMFVRADVAKEDDVRALVERTVAEFGALHHAFNNAAVELPQQLVEATVEDYRRVFDTNVLGVILSMKHEIPAILKSGGGSITNTASGAASVGLGGASIYSASKGAVVALTRAAAIEYAQQGVRINVLSPGGVDTAMLERFTSSVGGSKEWIAEKHPLGRIGRPEEIAAAAVFLASEGASFITGHDLLVDGGYTAQ